MNTDKFGQQIYSERDLIDLYMQDPDRLLKDVLVKEILSTNGLDLNNFPKQIQYVQQTCSVNEFDKLNQSVFFMPEEYKKMDIAKFVLEQCKDDAELQRTGEELLLYQEREMFDLLRYLKYLVDMMRKNNIVWGVGRGSSVASFVLFLIGVHKINSIYYDLDIKEFLK